MRLKNQIPNLKGNELYKEDLINYINNIVNNNSVILINAPAGYGKTTSIISWLRKKNIKKVSWISLDIFDNKLKDFLVNLLESNIFIDKSIFYAHEKEISENKYENYILSIVKNISNIPETVYLIIDDLQVINSIEVFNAFNYLIHNIPSNLKLILLSRNSQKELLFSELKRRNNFFELGYDKFIFNRTDIRNYIQIDDINESSIDLIIKKTGGWIFSIQILNVLLKDKNNKIEIINNFSGNNKNIKDFLISEIIENLNEEVQSFLLKTSFLKTFNYELCNYIVGIDNSDSIINYLINNNLFLISLDYNNEWFKYHDLFSDFLFSIFKIKYKDDIKEFYIKTSDWYKNKNNLDESIKYSFLANDYNYMINIIESNFKKMFLEKKIFKLLEWFSNIPLDILITYPLSYLHFLKCVSFYAEYSYIFELESMINQFEIFYKDKPLNNEILFNFYYLKAICSLAKKESKYIKTNIDKMLIYIEDNNFEFMARTNLMLGYYYDLEYDLNNSIYCYKLASKYFYNNNEYERYIECFYHIGTSLLEHGKLRDAKLILLEIIKNEPLNNKNILLYQNLYEIHYHLNEIDSLNIIISNILKLKGSLNFLQLFIVLYCSIYYNILLSSFDKVDAYIIQLNQLLNNGKFIEEENVYILITLKYIKLRELDKCKEFVDKYIYITSLDSFKTLKPGILTLFIESLILLNKLSDAEIIINKSLIESQKLTTEQITIYLLKAFLHYNQNNLNESKASIYKALKIGEKEGFIRLFTDSHKEIRHLILEVLNSKISISKKYINSIKKSFYAEDKNLLSSREIEILKFICDGLSNKQISDKLYISLNTVKAHIAHIFKKLNIERRTQATQKLKELNL